jgi:hypothetical protein
VMLMELWQIKDKIYHFRGYEVNTHVLGLLKYHGIHVPVSSMTV